VGWEAWGWWVRAFVLDCPLACEGELKLLAWRKVRPARGRAWGLEEGLPQYASYGYRQGAVLMAGTLQWCSLQSAACATTVNSGKTLGAPWGGKSGQAAAGGRRPAVVISRSCSAFPPVRSCIYFPVLIYL
jgi:hypothetical protein